MALKIVPLGLIVLDDDLQARAEIERALIDEYAQHLVDGVSLPPPVVFQVDNQLLLADGVHRYHAHAALMIENIEIEVRHGTRRDAMLYALSANSKHGKPLSHRDFKRAYDIAVANKLVDPLDVEDVRRIIGCAGRTAERFTEAARAVIEAEKEKERQERDAKIIQLHKQGNSDRKIASQVGVSPQHVGRKIAQHDTAPERVTSPPVADRLPKSAPEQKRAPSPPPQSDDDIVAPGLTRRAVKVLDELEAEPAQAWAAMLRALRAINELPNPAEMMGKLRYAKFDHVVEEHLPKACDWINQMWEAMYGQDTKRGRR